MHPCRSMPTPIQFGYKMLKIVPSSMLPPSHLSHASIQIAVALAPAPLCFHPACQLPSSYFALTVWCLGLLHTGRRLLNCLCGSGLGGVHFSHTVWECIAADCRRALCYTHRVAVWGCILLACPLHLVRVQSDCLPSGCSHRTYV